MPPTLAQQAQKAADALRQGRFATALKIARAVLKSDPRQGFFANLAGLALVQSGDARGAVPYFQSAIRAEPGMIDAHRNLAQAMIHAGTPDKALPGLQKARGTWPDDPGLLYLAASAHHAAQDATATVAAVDMALGRVAATAPLHRLRALAFETLGNSPAAETDHQAAARLAPQDPETITAHAGFLARHARAPEAQTLIAAGLRSHPQHPGLLLEQANLCHAAGDSTGALAGFSKLRAVQPDNALALNGLAYLADTQQAKALRADIAKAMRDPKTARDIKVLLGFAMAELARRSAAPDAARLLTQANAAATRATPYDAAADAAAQVRLMAPFTAAAPPGNPATQAPVPVFVVGLIRSGTTLAEQVLASHPAVVSHGELTRARQLAEAAATRYHDDGSLPDGAAFAESYRAGLPPMAPDISHSVDKMPDNFRIVGYLLAAFPNAVILEMQRDPRDVALSMWATLFPTTAHSYANDMAAMANHMNLYARTLQQWRKLFPGRVHGLAYADLVRNPRATSQRMADLCGLAWNENMLHPERNASVVMTASAQQVRQPVHTRSLDKWRGQTDLLSPLIAGLDPDLWPMIAQD